MTPKTRQEVTVLIDQRLAEREASRTLTGRINERPLLDRTIVVNYDAPETVTVRELSARAAAQYKTIKGQFAQIADLSTKLDQERKIGRLVAERAVEPTWTTSAGVTERIVDMNLGHLRNTLALLERSNLGRRGVAAAIRAEINKRTGVIPTAAPRRTNCFASVPGCTCREDGIIRDADGNVTSRS